MSTFAAPGSATSGLQGYSLEGSDKKTKHGKATKEEAGYVDNSPTRQCHTCTMFMAPNACTAVKGKISPDGHCNFYESAGASKKAPPRAAGIALISRNDGKTLFLRRHEDGDDHPGEWNFPGGGIEPGETEEAAALRELFEETGIKLTDDGSRAAVGTVKNPDIEYTTFVQKVDDQIEPRLNSEHSAFRWASLDFPPEPLHPWVRAALPLVKSAAVDLTLKAAAAANPQEENIMDNLSLFVPVLKVDAVQRMVYGTAVAEEPDRANEIFDYASSKPEFEKWSSDISKASDGKSLGNVRAMHGAIAAGKVTDISFDDTRKAIDVATKIVDDNEWKKVEEGVYTGFSIGGKYLKRWQDGELKRYTAAPSEISLVDLPCVPGATFQLIKADGSEELIKFVTVEKTEQTEKAAEVTVKVDIDTSKAVEKLNEVKEAAEKAAEAVVKVSDADLADEAQVWVHKRLPGKMFAKKADLRQALFELDAQEAAAKKAADVIAAIDGKTTTPEGEVKKVAEGEPKADDKSEVEKRQFSADERKKDAKSGAAEADGSYPIENKTDLENAIRAYGRSKNKAKTKRHIIARARSLGLTSMLPDDWKAKKVAENEDLEKDASLYGMSDLMNMLACVECLEDRAETPGFGLGIDLPKDITDRFGLALVNLGDVVADILDAVLASIREDERDEAVNRAAEIAGLMKQGARAVATPETQKAKNGDLEKAADTEKVAEENEALKAQLAAEKAAFDKALAAVKDEVSKRDAERDAKVAEQETRIAKAEARNDELQKQVMMIRNTSVTAPRERVFRVVDKSVDTAGEVEKAELPADQELRQRGINAQLARIGGPR